MESYNLEILLNAEYNMDVISIEKNEESTDGNVYIILDSNQTRYAIKVYDNIKHANAMTNIHTYVNEIGLNAPKIITNNLGEKITKHKDRYIVCYSFVEGVKLKDINLSDEIISNIANYLRALHSINSNRFNVEAIPYSIDANRQSILHFDITKHNIFINQEDNNTICFIAFDVVQLDGVALVVDGPVDLEARLEDVGQVVGIALAHEGLEPVGALAAAHVDGRDRQFGAPEGHNRVL